MSHSRIITFEAFMRTALHDPERGYYARNIRRVGGARADFTTVPVRFGAVISKAIAGWAADVMRRTGCRDLIEIGPGEGTLIRDVFQALPWHIRWRARLHLVETSEVLRERQRALLRKRAVWHATPREAMEACGGRAVIFSNELVDAFPVRVFQKCGDQWSELAVEWSESGRAIREVMQENPDLPESSIFDLPHPQGQRVEVHERYHHWLTDWLPCWRAGEMLTIDYGDAAENLYHRRPAGTMRGYLLHQRVTGHEIYQNVGMQDLTADVNFTDLARWAGPWCRSFPCQTLAGFLRDHEARGIEPGLANDDGIGGAFRVLRQSPGTSPTSRFRGE